MEVLASSAVSTVNWFVSNSSSRDGHPLAKSPVQYITNIYNYWQSAKRRAPSQSSDGNSYFVSIPDDINLNILSYLDATSLCHLAQTCRNMHRIASDYLLWRNRLHHDVLSWATLDHLSHPKVYEEIDSDLSYKEIYARCSTMRHTAQLDRPFSNGVLKVFRSLTRKLRPHIPRVIMFGSGLESLPLVRNMFWEDASPYRPVKLFPGKEGIGSGVCIKHRNYQDINLITLYTSTRAERKSAANGQRPVINKLLSAYHSDDRDDQQLTPAIRELCSTVDAYIFVVDSSKAAVEGLESDSTMLSTMLHCASPDAPILVWACTHTRGDQTMPAVEVANSLQLLQLRNPWKVQSMDIETFSGMNGSMDWLVKHLL